jgi:hypothetical protein
VARVKATYNSRPSSARATDGAGRLVRHEAALDPGDDHRVPFTTLRRMEGEQIDAVGRRVVERIGGRDPRSERGAVAERLLAQEVEDRGRHTALGIASSLGRLLIGATSGVRCPGAAATAGRRAVRRGCRAPSPASARPTRVRPPGGRPPAAVTRSRWRGGAPGARPARVRRRSGRVVRWCVPGQLTSPVRTRFGSDRRTNWTTSACFVDFVVADEALHHRAVGPIRDQRARLIRDRQHVDAGGHDLRCASVVDGEPDRPRCPGTGSRRRRADSGSAPLNP